MKKLTAALATLPLALTGVAVAAAPAHADDRRCTGTIRAVSIDDNVIVPAGATCTLLGTRIDGNVEVKRNGTLIARGVRVDGNIEADDFKRVVVGVRTVNGGLARSVVGGNIDLDDGGNGDLRRIRIDGNIELDDSARFVIQRNVVDGNLICSGNRPAPTGGGNVVEGDKEGQCSRL